MISRLLLLSLLSVQAYALFSTMDTADLIKDNEYRAGIETQFGLSRGHGFNGVAHFDMGVASDSNLKFLIGTGTTPIQLGGFLKMVPFPDMARQPGIGAFAGVVLTAKDGTSGLHFRFHPLISKKLRTPSMGQITPYGSVPFGISTVEGKTTTPVNLEVGVNWIPPGMKHLSFWGEIGADLNSSFSYFSLGVTSPFDQNGGPYFD